jgi:hypothetical protein
MTLPPHVRAACERILDSEARRIFDSEARLLADQLDRDAMVPAGSDENPVNGGADQRSARVKRQPIPILGRVDRDRGTEAAA